MRKEAWSIIQVRYQELVIFREKNKISFKNIRG